MINEMREFVFELVKSEYETHHRPIETKDEFEQFCADEGVRCTNSMWDLYQKYHMEGLDELATEGFDEIIEEALSNKEKLKRAYPELNFGTPVAETLNEAVDAEDKMQTAVGILYDMDNYVLSVYDSDYWLSMGVPDGEFSENDRDLAEANYKEHEWLIEDEGFDTEAFKDLLDAFQTATRGRDYDQNERARIIHEAETILNMTESVEDMDRRCEECNTLLNDMGKCPKCDEGEEDLDEVVLNEAPDKLTKKLDKLSAKDDKLMLKRAEAVSTIIRKSIDPSYRYVVNGNIIDAAAYRAKVDKVKNELLNSDKLLSIDPSSSLYKEVKDVLDIVAIDKKGWIVRRGLELIKPGKMAYRADRADLLEIPDAASCETFLGKQFTKKSEPSAENSENKAGNDQPANTEAKPEPASDNDTNTPSNAEANQEVKTPEWITNESIKAAITLLAKRKDGSSEYYDKEGNLVDYRKINTENVNDIFTDKEATKPLISALEEVKKGLAKRKAAAIKSAALFGESYDLDDLQEGIKDIFKFKSKKAAEKPQKWGLVDNQYGRVVYKYNSKDEAEDAWRAKPQSQQFRFRVEPIDEDYDDIMPEACTYVEASELLSEEFLTHQDIVSSLNIEQAEMFERVRQKAAYALNSTPEALCIFVDYDGEYQPYLVADESKELARGIVKYKVAVLDLVCYEFRGTNYLYFANKADADAYLDYCRENI